jgi:predicted TIM-barrel enzyme
MLRLVWSHPRTTDAHRYRVLDEAGAYPGMLREALRPGMFMDTLPCIPTGVLIQAARASKADAVDILLRDTRLHVSGTAGAMAVDCALLHDDAAHRARTLHAEVLCLCARRCVRRPGGLRDALATAHALARVLPTQATLAPA